MSANTRMRLICDGSVRSTDRFSPAEMLPERSSPSRVISGRPLRLVAVNALPSACTTPFVPSLNSYRQPRSRSSWNCFLKKPRSGGFAFQFRLTRNVPVAPPCLVSETLGAAFVSVTLFSETALADGAAGGGGGGGGAANGGGAGGSDGGGVSGRFV